MKALTQKHKQCHCKNGSVKVGGAQTKKHPIFILDDRRQPQGPILVSSCLPSHHRLLYFQSLCKWWELSELLINRTTGKTMLSPSCLWQMTSGN